MDLFSLMVVLLANWDSWSLEDLITVMLQDIDDSEDSFWAILQAVCSSIEDEHTGRDWWVFPRSDCWWENLAGCVKYSRIIIEILANRRKLFCKFVGLPRGRRLNEIINRFEGLSNIPLIVGARDGCQIRLRKKPAARHFPAEYWNRHHHHSVLLQGVSDSDRNFLDVACLLPGSQHDATHLRLSSLWHKFTNNLIFQVPQKTLTLPAASTGNSGRIRGDDQIIIKPYLVGDAAYPLTPYIMKAFNTRRTSTGEKNDFDKALRRCRVRIEHTFGLLKSRWKICDTGCPLRIEEVADCVMACCVLNNFVNYGGNSIRETD
ncbi:hypothetical protein R1flu_021707 [Riccia fluitans]|uniref:DDE Tnp4 domain-containing protein n=1 Tax=Riccia fluitans TaxID=41844 RepID=A0ABD1ZQ58_9MARC